MDCVFDMLLMPIDKVCVKCNQSGKLFNVKVEVLSREDMEPLGETDLYKGSQLLMEMKKKSYPVTVEKVISPLTVSNVKREN